MFNNINENNTDILNAQYGAKNIVNISAIRSAHNKNGYVSNPYVDKTEISSDAMKLFQRDLDIKNFTKLIVESKDDISYLEQMSKLFEDGVVDPYEENVLSELASNQKLLDDIER